MRTSRMNSASVICGENIYVFCGSTTSYDFYLFNPKRKYLSDYECFNINRKSWSEKIKIEGLTPTYNFYHHIHEPQNKNPVTYKNLIYFFNIKNDCIEKKIVLVYNIYDISDKKWITPTKNIELPIQHIYTPISLFPGDEGIYISAIGYTNLKPCHHCLFYNIHTNVFIYLSI